MRPAHRLMAYIKRLFLQAPQLREDDHPNYIKAQLPRAAFTKKGPGVRHELRKDLLGLNPAQRKVAKAKGWEKGLKL